MPDATANLAASLITALEVIGALDFVLQDRLHIDLDHDIPQWSPEQRAAIALARAQRAAEERKLAAKADPHLIPLDEYYRREREAKG